MSPAPVALRKRPRSRGVALTAFGARSHSRKNTHGKNTHARVNDSAKSKSPPPTVPKKRKAPSTDEPRRIRNEPPRTEFSDLFAAMRPARDNAISPYVKLTINKVHDATAVSSKRAQQRGRCNAEGLASGDPGTWTNFLSDSIFYELERSEVDLKLPPLQLTRFSH
ncbi:hypothetical protein M569_14255 [Genlisea aurea]|uniref:Uncharacterized protein n=1 Tax=Genlisea aurea TaxID=192259 RepID=S8DCK8_9LAMI|nr:hypothetical protein M569_14255 [Genlisea aurea]